MSYPFREFNEKESIHPVARSIDTTAMETYSWWKASYVYIHKTRVKTWRGVAIISFLSGAVAAIVWTISINITSEM